MFNFSQKSIERLRTCDIDLQRLFEHVIKKYDCTIICGHRSEEEQNQAFEAGNSQLQYPNSKHNSYPSMAVDAVPYEINKIDWGKTQSAYFAGFVRGVAAELLRTGYMSHEIRCGLDWDNDNDVDDTKFWDACHFELIPKI